jgi:hypothetical protein
MHQHDVRLSTHDGDRGKVLQRVIRRFGHDRQHRERRRRSFDERVAVRRRARAELGADEPTAARPVVDDDRSAERGDHALRDESCHEVRAAARPERHDDADRFGRVRLRSRLRTEPDEREPENTRESVTRSTHAGPTNPM